MNFMVNRTEWDSERIEEDGKEAKMMKIFSVNLTRKVSSFPLTIHPDIEHKCQHTIIK